jgi:L-ribulokinase
VGITREGEMLAIMGTSTCHMMMAKPKRMARHLRRGGTGIMPGYYGYEAAGLRGRPLPMFIETCLPKSCYDEAAAQASASINTCATVPSAKTRGKRLVARLVERQPFGACGYGFNGLMLGMTLQTKPAVCTAR